MSALVPPTLRWEGDPLGGVLILLDQTLLPEEIRELPCRDVAAVWEAIRSLRVRGAPAIGIAAAFGVVLGVQSAPDDDAGFLQQLDATCAYLTDSRPTAVNLSWALERMRRRARTLPSTTHHSLWRAALLQEAQQIQSEDRAMCHAIGEHGATLLQHGQSVLTHCNAGGLATAGYGTALAVIFSAHEQGKALHVFVDETRPLYQGARLTAWELLQRQVPTTLICDSMAAQVMREGRVQAVITGADRIALNGDTANKIGTYGLAVLARAHGIPFYVAAPSSTFDRALADGTSIPIEQRAAEEITHSFGRQVAPQGVGVYNPAFDVTPAEYITAIVTECGIVRPVLRENIDMILEKKA